MRDNGAPQTLFRAELLPGEVVKVWTIYGKRCEKTYRFTDGGVVCQIRHRELKRRGYALDEASAVRVLERKLQVHFGDYWERRALRDTMEGDRDGSPRTPDQRDT